MDDFFKKWKEDKRFRTKIKLITYTAFFVIVSIYALSLDTGTYSNLSEDISNKDSVNKEHKKFLNIPEEYDYTITINIDNKEYKYLGKQTKERKTIQKIINNKATNYIYQNEKYYIEDMVAIDNYIITTRDEVYDIINYNYIDLNTINEYLNKATKEGNQYLVYLKDVILGNDSDNYFVIELNENNIYIDYTVLMKEFNKELNKYIINIELKELLNDEANEKE